MPLPPRVVASIRPRRGLGASLLNNLPGSSAGNQVSTTANNLQNQATSLQNQATSTVQAYANSAGIPLVAPNQAVNYATTLAYQNLPPDVQAAVSSGVNLIQNAQPAYDLADMIANGQTPSEQQVILGLSAIVGTVNPIAGGMMLTIGEFAAQGISLLQNLFQTIGFAPNNTIPPTWDYNGLLRVNLDTIPVPPVSGEPVDPLWMPLRPTANLTSNGVADCSSGYSLPPNLPATYAPNDTSCARNAPFLTSIFWAAARAGLQTQVGPYAFDWIGQTLNGSSFGSIATDVPAAMFAMGAPTAFEQYFNTLWLQTAEYWANGNPYVPARQLLSAVTTVWNSQHPHSAVTTFVPQVLPTYAAGANPFSGAQPTNHPTNGNGGLISLVLGPSGGELAPEGQLTDDYPIQVNGADGSGSVTTTTSPATIAASLTAPATPFTGAIATVAALPAGVALGSVAYSLAVGRPALAGLQALWAFARSRIPL